MASSASPHHPVAFAARSLTSRATLLALTVDSSEYAVTPDTGMGYDAHQTLVDHLLEVRTAARRARRPVEIDLPGGTAVVHPFVPDRRPGDRAYSLFITTADFRIFIDRRGCLVQLASAFLWSVGPLKAFEHVHKWCTKSMGGGRWTISRLDISADVLGVNITAAQRRHLVSYPRLRALREDSDRVEEIRFGADGADAIMRIYPQRFRPTAGHRYDFWVAALRAQGVALPPADAVVWRVEPQLRRDVLVNFEEAVLGDPDGSEAIRRLLGTQLPVIWTYYTGEWCSLRRPRKGKRARWKPLRWWSAMNQAGSLLATPVALGPVGRQSRTTASVERLLPTLAGMVTTLAAVLGVSDLEQVFEELREHVRNREPGWFVAEVDRKSGRPLTESEARAEL